MDKFSQLELYPRPNIMKEIEGEEFPIPQGLNLGFVGSLNSSIKENVSKMCKRCFGEEIRPVLSEKSLSSTMNCFLICGNDHDEETKKLLANPEPKEGAYALSLKKGMAKVASANRLGVLQGVQTLLEIFRCNAKQGFIKPIFIQDSPFVQIRGVHLFLPAKEDIPFYKRFVSRFLAPLHYNTVFIEVGGGMRFEREPEINKGWGKFAEWVFEHEAMPVGPDNRLQDPAHAEVAGGSFLEKDEVQDLVNWTNSCGLEVIPEIQSLTHSYYLTAGHREISELPEAIWPGSYCPSNPKSYEILFNVIEEYIEVMNPKTIHIGHDEWREPALCPKCKGRAPELFAKDVSKIHDFLQSKNIRTAMWTDGLLPAYDGKTTYTCIDEIPKDILLLHWYWSVDRRFQDRLSSRGFQMILGNFGPSINQEEWNNIARRSEVLGAEISSWVGMNQDRFAIDDITWRILVGAEVLWSGKKPSLDKTWRVASECVPRIVSRLGEYPLISYSKKFKSIPVDLTPYLNAQPKITGKNTQWDVTFLYPGKHEWRRIIYEIVNSWVHKNKIGVGVSYKKSNIQEGMGGEEVGFEERTHDESLLSFPKEVTDIELNKKIKGLVFFHFASTKGKQEGTTDHKNPLLCAELLGYYEINYASGAKEVVELRYGLNIASMDRFVGSEDKGPLLYAPPAIRRNDLSLSSSAIWGFEWRNPRPHDRVVFLAIQSVETESNAFPVLIALSMLI